MSCFIRFILSFGIVICLSCRENYNNKNLKNFDFLVNLPDSVLIDSPIVGFIKYNVSNSPLPDKIIFKKYTFLYTTLNKKNVLSFDELKKMPHDTFVPIEKNLIPIYKIKSQDKGDVIFNGFLIEQFFYKIEGDSIRIISKERRFEKIINVY